MRLRSTVLGLMSVVACFAVALAAIRTNDEYTAAIVFAITFLILCTCTLFAIYRRGAWAGFAVFGWAQFLICQPNTAPPVGATSLTNRVAYRLLVRYHGTGQDIPRLSIPIPEFTSVIDVGEGKPSLVSQSNRAFGQTLVHRGLIPVHGLRACLCVSSLLAGLLGAAVGGFVARRCTTEPVPSAFTDVTGQV
jgi:hypothetical protein